MSTTAMAAAAATLPSPMADTAGMLLSAAAADAADAAAAGPSAPPAPPSSSLTPPLPSLSLLTPPLQNAVLRNGKGYESPAEDCDDNVSETDTLSHSPTDPTLAVAAPDLSALAATGPLVGTLVDDNDSLVRQMAGLRLGGAHPAPIDVAFATHSASSLMIASAPVGGSGFLHNGTSANSLESTGSAGSSDSATSDVTGSRRRPVRTNSKGHCVSWAESMEIHHDMDDFEKRRKQHRKRRTKWKQVTSAVTSFFAKSDDN